MQMLSLVELIACYATTILFQGTVLFQGVRATDTEYSLNISTLSDFVDVKDVEKFFSLQRVKSTWAVVLSRTIGHQMMKVRYKRLVRIKQPRKKESSHKNTKVIFVREDDPANTSVAKVSDSFDDSLLHSSQTSFRLEKYYGNFKPGLGVLQIDLKGNLFLMRKLDFEKGDTHFGLIVIAQDPSGGSQAVKVVMNVINVNDNPPVFRNVVCLFKCTDPGYFAEVEENFVGVIRKYVAGPIIAYDADGDPLEYSLVEGSDPGYEDFIEIDKDTGDLTLKKPLSEVASGYLDIAVLVVSNSNLPDPINFTLPAEATSAILIYSKDFTKEEQISRCHDVQPAVAFVYGAMIMSITKNLA